MSDNQIVVDIDHTGCIPGIIPGRPFLEDGWDVSGQRHNAIVHGNVDLGGFHAGVIEHPVLDIGRDLGIGAGDLMVVGAIARLVVMWIRIGRPVVGHLITSVIRPANMAGSDPEDAK